MEHGSPILESIRLHHTKKDLEELKEAVEIERRVIDVENEWKSCCLVVDRRAVLFFSQLSISLIVLTLCVYNLVVHHDSCDSNQLYTGLLTMIIGVWIDAPKMRK
jgi:hypothetical protein